MPGSSGLPMPRLGRFLNLSLADKFLLLKCVLIVAAIRLGLRLFSYNMLRRWLATATAPALASDAVAERVGWGIDTAARLVPGATCLTKALAAQLLLGALGVPVADAHRRRQGRSGTVRRTCVAHQQRTDRGRRRVRRPAALCCTHRSRSRAAVSAIAGMLHTDGRPVEPPALERMLGATAHREP